MTTQIISIARVGPQRTKRKPGERTFEDIYKVETGHWSSDSETLANLVLAHPRVPPFWPTYPAAKLQEIELDQINNARRYWEARLTWSSGSTGGDGGSSEEAENPLIKRIQRSVNFTDGTMSITTDVYGNIIASTAGEPYDPQEISVGILEIGRTWNTVNFTDTDLLLYRRATNADNWRGFSPGTLIARFTGNEVYLPPNTVYPQGLVYWELSAKIRINPDVEDNKIRTVNQGFYKLTDKDKQTRIMVPEVDPEDEDEKVIRYVPSEKPVLLSEDGKSELPKGQPPYIQEWDVLYPVQFSGFIPE
jgi:hypothetical protein